MKLIDFLQNVYRLLADDRLEKLGLFSIKEGKIATPLADDTLSLMTHRSKRPDALLEQATLEGIIAAIKASSDSIKINHIGFCYKTPSVENEVKRITKIVRAKRYKAYREPSTDDAAWIFVGDISEINNPILEFLPHEGGTNDPWIDYWLPHIQFDIDTSLSPGEIEAIVKKFIDRPFTPYPIEIDGVTYIQRVNLGCREGVNIMLDIATNNRNITYRKTWPELTSH